MTRAARALYIINVELACHLGTSPVRLGSVGCSRPCCRLDPPSGIRSLRLCAVAEPVALRSFPPGPALNLIARPRTLSIFVVGREARPSRSAAPRTFHCFFATPSNRSPLSAPLPRAPAVFSRYYDLLRNLLRSYSILPNIALALPTPRSSLSWPRNRTRVWISAR
jgi:hypothetical protein